MSDQVAPGASDANPEVAGVDGSQQTAQPVTPEGYVPQSDMDALRSTYDQRLHQMEQRLRDEERKRAMADMDETEQLQYRAEQAERQLHEMRAKQSFANQLSAQSGMSVHELMTLATPEAMQQAAFDYVRSQQAAPQQQWTNPVQPQAPTPAPVPGTIPVAPQPSYQSAQLGQQGVQAPGQQPVPVAPSGASMAPPAQPVDPVQQRAELFAQGGSGLNDFVKSFVPDREDNRGGRIK